MPITKEVGGFFTLKFLERFQRWLVNVGVYSNYIIMDLYNLALKLEFNVQTLRVSVNNYYIMVSALRRVLLLVL